MGVQMDGGIGSCDFGHMSEINIREQILSFPEHASFSLKAEIPEEARRSKAFSRLFRSCMAAERPLTSQEVRAILDHQH